MTVSIDGTNGITYPVGTGVMKVGPTLMTAQNTTSGTSIDFTGIPAGVKRITVMLNGVSTNSGTNQAIVVQCGTGGVATATGYNSVISYFGSSTLTTSSGYSQGFTVWGAVANAMVITGTVVLTNISGNTWVAVTNTVRTDSASSVLSAGSITLSGVLNMIRLTTASGADTFDAGSANILYE